MQSSILFIALLFGYGFISDDTYAAIEENYVILHTKIENSISYPDGTKKNRNTNQNLKLICDKPTFLSNIREENTKTGPDKISKNEITESALRVTANCLPNQMVSLDFEIDQSKSEIILKINGDKGVLTVNETLQTEGAILDGKISLQISAQVTK